ncbi:3340_t:CDS:1, partial [Cetraspora pellucida]
MHDNQQLRENNISINSTNIKTIMQDEGITLTTNHLQAVKASNESEANNIVILMNRKDKNKQVAMSLLVKMATEASAA